MAFDKEARKSIMKFSIDQLFTTQSGLSGAGSLLSLLLLLSEAPGSR